jgi:hypothetical protein
MILQTTANGPNYSSLARRAAPRLFLIPMAIAVQPADISFVYFHDAHQFTEIGIGHSSAKAMAYEP